MRTLDVLAVSTVEDIADMLDYYTWSIYVNPQDLNLNALSIILVFKSLKSL